MISKTMKLQEIVLSFPQKAQKLRRIMRNLIPCSHELPNEPLETVLVSHGKKHYEIELFIKKLNDVLQEQTSPDAISLTETAANQLKALLSREEKIDWGLVIADQPASCGTGFEYKLGFSQHPAPEDIVFYSHGMKIYTPRATVNRFLGSLIDYEEGPIDDHHFEGLLKLGFTISNPNVKTTCPCGCSNNYDEKKEIAKL